MSEEDYWARAEPDRLAKEVMDHWNTWRRYYAESSMAEKADKGRRYYYGLNDLAESSSKLQVGGNKAQFVKAVVNHVRSLVQRSLAMLSSRAPTMQPVAANSDSAARQQAISARGILDHVHREHDTESMDDEVLEIAMVMGEGFRLILWDANEGEPTAIDEETQEPIALAGDFANHALTPFDVARDPTCRTWRKLPWLIARTFESRYELAARLPEKADAILRAGRDGTGTATALDGFDMRFGVGADLLSRGDAVAVYHFFHRDMGALRGGRYFTCLNEGTWLTDGPNPYKGIPLERCTPGRVIATSMGYSNVFDALGVSDLLNSLHSVFATHTTRWGIPPLIDFQGSGIQHAQLANGTSVLTVKDPNFAPKPLEVPSISTDVYNHASKLETVIDGLLGMNPTATGNPPFSGMAAQAMALLDQKAQEFHEGLAKSFGSYKQACATRELEILKAFADDPRMAVIQGKAKAWMLKSFTKEDLAHVDRVAMEAAPPGTGTLAWKFGMLEALAKFGVQLAPEQVLELARTGQMDSQFEYEEANRLRIKSENEMLQEGKTPPVIIARTHWLDIPEHLALLSSPDITTRPDMVDAVISTVQAKLDAWRNMPSDLLMLLGGPPPPPPAIPAGALPPPMPVPPPDEEAPPEAA